jgi:hypothetical protein
MYSSFTLQAQKWLPRRFLPEPREGCLPNRALSYEADKSAFLAGLICTPLKWKSKSVFLNQRPCITRR